MPDSVSGDNWEVGEKFTIFFREVDIIFDNIVSSLVPASEGKT